MHADETVMEQEISQMLSGNLSNQDEDEVEDELAALQRETQRLQNLPHAPKSKLPERSNEGESQEIQYQGGKAKAQPAIPA